MFDSIRQRTSAFMVKPTPESDTFYLTRIGVTILPVNLAAAAITTEGLAMVGLARGNSSSAWVPVISMVTGLVLLGLAGLCRMFAQRNNLTGAAVVTLAFGGISSTVGSATASSYGRGAVSMMPTVMMFAFVGAVVAQRYWHVIFTWIVVVGPMLYLASLEPPLVPQQGYQLSRFCFGVVSTTSLFYWVVMKVKLSYYQLYVRLYAESRTDELTGLLNRRAWTAETTQRLAALPDDAWALVLYLDVDSFKAVNDGGGHEAGDRLLAQLAEALSAAFGSHSTIGRIGGDEFIVFCDPDREPDRLKADARQRIQTVRTLMHPDTVSVGGAVIGNETTVNQGIRLADAALIRAKQTGRDRLEFLEKTTAAPVVENRDPDFFAMASSALDR